MQMGTQEIPARSMLNPGAASGAGGRGRKLSRLAKVLKYEEKGR